MRVCTFIVVYRQNNLLYAKVRRLASSPVNKEEPHQDAFFLPQRVFLDRDLERAFLSDLGEPEPSSLYLDLWILWPVSKHPHQVGEENKSYQLFPTMLMPLASAWR